MIFMERLKKLELTTLRERRIRGNLIETFKTIYGFSIYGRQFFNISPQTRNLLSRQISKAKFTNQLIFYELRNVEQVWNKLPNQIKNSNSIKKFKDKIRWYQK